MTRQPLLPSPTEARRLADLVADARAIPPATLAAGAGRSSAEPLAQPSTVQIPESIVSLVEAAEHHWADYSR